MGQLLYDVAEPAVLVWLTVCPLDLEFTGGLSARVSQEQSLEPAAANLAADAPTSPSTSSGPRISSSAANIANFGIEWRLGEKYAHLHRHVQMDAAGSAKHQAES